ncbi:MAG: U32 family peptidase [Clostridia bacterium]|nr:U32 family peptidase [Clostridia bacterium]
MNKTVHIPELLAPAGSPEALDAAIAGGADAVYFGGAVFNARMNAKNFADDALRDAIDKCRLYGVKTNITLNTLVHNREMHDVLKYVEELYTLGADALIVADLGAARLIHRYFPDFELHASTQAAGHNTDAARTLADMGFSRMVAARELSRDDLAVLCTNSPIETEMFIHGAICVSQSGGCLASSLIGGRSGNRGECAQPCRLPYKRCGAKERDTYALSLKDICLASHITEILDLGVASLKIEGRMKSPDYVYGVTRIYRRLLDERRNATQDELAELRALFSRSGFTDGYYTKTVDRKMLGIRTEADKAESADKTAKATDYAALCRERRRPLNMRIRIEAGKPAELYAEVDGVTATVCGAIPDKAENRPMTYESVIKNLEKLGNTPFRPGSGTVRLDDGLIMPLSALNALRRDAVDAITAKLTLRREPRLPGKLDMPSCELPPPAKTARFCSYDSIPDHISGCDIVYLPLEKFSPEMCDRVNGVIIPPVVFDSEVAEISAMLKTAANAGIRHALVSNLGHIALAMSAGMVTHGDFRLNIFNAYTAEALLELGFADLIASPELTLPQLRDLGLPPIIYGRVPLMTLEKCVIRDLYSCDECKKRSFLPMRDRKGTDFPLTRAWRHRNIMYNSVPIFMEDKRNELIRYRIGGGHYIFTDESREEVKALLSGKPLPPKDGKIRRIVK